MNTPGTIIVSLMDIVTMMDNVVRGPSFKNVGYLDASKPMGELLLNLDRRVKIDTADFESALATCTFAEEAGKFRHHKGQSFVVWVNGMTQHFDTNYNYLKGNK